MKTINHPIFGQGNIVSELNGKATIDFNGTVKTLIVKFAHMTNEDGTEFVGSTELTRIEPKSNPYQKKVTAAQRQAKLSEKLNVTASRPSLTQKEKEDLEDYMNAKKWGSISW